MENNNKGCLSFLFPLLKLFNNKSINNGLPYAKRDDFLSISELAFYKVLNNVIKDDMTICSKVGLKDIFYVKSGDNKNRSIYNNKIAQKHVDFLVCKISTLEPLCGIELDDSTHKRRDRIDRDVFVNEIFKVSKLPLIRFENKNSYTINEIKEKLEYALNMYNIEKSKGINSIAKNKFMCPKCGIEMIMRTSQKGKNIGKKFYGCANYPKCRQVIQIDE